MLNAWGLRVLPSWWKAWVHAALVGSRQCVACTCGGEACCPAPPMCLPRRRQHSHPLHSPLLLLGALCCVCLLWLSASKRAAPVCRAL